jgi:hypothetical protein
VTEAAWAVAVESVIEAESVTEAVFLQIAAGPA